MAAMDSRDGTGQQHRAGFWVRLAAFWIDGVIVWAAVKVIVLVARIGGVYLPAELSVILLGACYWVALTGWRGQTVGKALCGLTVVSGDGGPPGFVFAVLRECVGKPISALVFFLGFIWAALSRRKRAWHDYIARTSVVQDRAASGRARGILALVILITLGG